MSTFYAKEFFKINGKYCNVCKLDFESTLAESTGIIRVEINYITNIMMVQYDPDLITNIDLCKIMRNLKCKFLTVENNLYSGKKTPYLALKS